MMILHLLIVNSVIKNVKLAVFNRLTVHLAKETEELELVQLELLHVHVKLVFI